MINIKSLEISGKEVFPIIEGGKGIAVSTATTAGHFAKSGAVGTISGTNPDYYDENGEVVRYYFDPKWTRKEKFDKLVEYSIKGGIEQVRRAYDISEGKGRLHLNFLWEAGGTTTIMDAVLQQSKGMINGVTAGAGLPYALSEIAEKYSIYYYPIVSSSRAFSILWKRSYSKTANLLGGVVYEDPWLAGGHNGLSNKEDPNIPEDPFDRVAAIRTAMDAVGLQHVPIIIAGGVWRLKDWENYLDNPAIGKVAFQFGTRPLLTQESPIPDSWKKLLPTLKEGEVRLNPFSPTGFYSSAVRNKFLIELEERNERQVEVKRKADDEFKNAVPSGNGLTFFYVKDEDYERSMGYINEGFNTLMRTPDSTAIFVTSDKAEQIKEDQAGCMGCLSHCRFSGWCDKEDKNNTTGVLPDARSFCIEKTLQDIAHGGSIHDNLVFSGHHAYKFGTDPLYANGYIPTVKELVDAIMKGD